jgi:predicted nucleotidyltransferase
MLELLNSKIKMKILKFLVKNNKKELILSDIATLLKISKSRTSEVLKALENNNIVKSKHIGKSIIYSLNLDNENTKFILDIVKKSESKMEKILEEFISECKKKFGKDLISIILFGSYARGTYKETSDIDLLIIVNNLSKNWIENDKLIEDIEIKFIKKYDINIQSILTTPQSIEWHANWPNPIFYGILLGYKVLYNKNYFENLMKIVKLKIKEKMPIYIENGKKWNLITLT